MADGGWGISWRSVDSRTAFGLKIINRSWLGPDVDAWKSWPIDCLMNEAYIFNTTKTTLYFNQFGNYQSPMSRLRLKAISGDGLGLEIAFPNHVAMSRLQ